MTVRVEPRGATLARWLLWSHGVLAAILLSAVAITLAGLIAMNAAIAEIKTQHLADFEEEEQMHRAAWAIETEARHGALACERDEGAGAAVGARLERAVRELGALLRRDAHKVAPAISNAASGYQRYGQLVSSGDVCARLRDVELAQRRLLLDEQLTDSWILKLKELRLAIAQKELEAQRLGSGATLTGLGFGVLALIAAGLTARSVARSVTVPLERLARHARQLGEGDFAPLPGLRGSPREVAQLATELDRMRARLAEVSQLKQSFLDSVSHDLRTPLAHIREALALLLDGTAGPLQATQQRVAQLALRACEREIRLVSALLDLSRIRSGRPLRSVANQCVERVIEGALDNTRERASRAGVRIERRGEQSTLRLNMDPLLIETALSNVILNAVAVTPSGGVISVERSSVPEGPAHGNTAGPFLRIVVRDQGPGVSAALRSEIFEPFFTTKTGAESAGSGLGLTLARDMLRAHRGDLTLEPEAPEAGATFALWLPLHAAEGASAPPVALAWTRQLEKST